jgi:hypothetical protein
MTVQQKVAWFLCGIFVIVVLCVPALASAVDSKIVPYRYNKTKSITASLTITSGVATCKGRLSPADNYNCTLTVTLYKKNGNGWDFVQSWSDRAENGTLAYVNETKKVNRGVYKVVSVGNVDGEKVRVESAEKTY